MIYQQFLSKHNNIQLNERYGELVRLRDEKVTLETPEGKGYIVEFAAIGGELDAKFHFDERLYHNFYPVFQSKEDGSFHFGSVIEPFKDDELVFNGSWKIGNKKYTEKEFKSKFERVIL